MRATCKETLFRRIPVIGSTSSAVGVGAAGAAEVEGGKDDTAAAAGAIVGGSSCAALMAGAGASVTSLLADSSITIATDFVFALGLSPLLPGVVGNSEFRPDDDSVQREPPPFLGVSELRMRATTDGR